MSDMTSGGSDILKSGHMSVCYYVAGDELPRFSLFLEHGTELYCDDNDVLIIKNFNFKDIDYFVRWYMSYIQNDKSLIFEHKDKKLYIYRITDLIYLSGNMEYGLDIKEFFGYFQVRYRRLYYEGYK